MFLPISLLLFLQTSFLIPIGIDANIFIAAQLISYARLNSRLCGLEAEVSSLNHAISEMGLLLNEKKTENKSNLLPDSALDEPIITTELGGPKQVVPRSAFGERRISSLIRKLRSSKQEVRNAGNSLALVRDEPFGTGHVERSP